MPRSPRSQKLYTLTFRSAKTSGVVSVKESKTLITPRFSATKTRPSLAKRTTVGCVRPLKTTDSEKPAGSVAAEAVVGVVITTTAVARASSKLSSRDDGLRRRQGQQQAQQQGRRLTPSRPPDE